MIDLLTVQPHYCIASIITKTAIGLKNRDTKIISTKANISTTFGSKARNYELKRDRLNYMRYKRDLTIGEPHEMYNLHQK